MLMKYSRISTLKFPGGLGMGLGKMGLMFRARGLHVLTPVSTEGVRGRRAGGRVFALPMAAALEWCPGVERVERKWREVLT